MATLNTEVLIKVDSVIPIQVKQEAANWAHIILSNLPFIITMFVVMGSALVTYKINRKSIETQEGLGNQARNADHENKISEFRHHWLQELRNTASELAKVIHECQMHILKNNLSIEYRDSSNRAGQLDAAAKHQEAASINYERFLECRAGFYRYHAKLKLLFKNNDTQAEKLFSILNDVREKMGDPRISHLEDEVIDLIASELQVILKNEWETTKNRTWRHGT